LTEEARALLRGIRALALAVGPAALTETCLDMRPAGALLAWNVKADADAFPAPLRRRLLEAADLICFNRHELPFLAEAVGLDAAGPDEALRALAAGHGGILVMTTGAEGCVVAAAGGFERVPAEPIAVRNATGAGDIFFAACVAAILDGAAPVAAAIKATDVVRRVLAAREEAGV
jgi:sugar/nucleoside kinase (ribokinase family)